MKGFEMTAEQAAEFNSRPKIPGAIHRQAIASYSAPKPSKYGNHKVESDGVKFDSKRELARWNQLKMLESAGHITDLKRQVPFEVVPSVNLDGKKQRAVVYVADFTYTEEPGYMTVEDSKGFKTPDYIIKRKLMKHVFGIEVKES